MIPRNKKKLEALFLAGDVPDPKTLLGPKGEACEWRVDMLTGILPNMGGRWFHHRKQFVKMGDMILGCNLLFDNFHWGWFRVWNDGRAAYEDSRPVLFIDYDVPENNFLTSRIRDFVRTTSDPDVLIGRFNLSLKSRARFLGYFTLTRSRTQTARVTKK